jgi:polyhydroxyalkanoate synthesis regulator phasin
MKKIKFVPALMCTILLTGSLNSSVSVLASEVTKHTIDYSESNDTGSSSTKSEVKDEKNNTLISQNEGVDSGNNAEPEVNSETSVSNPTFKAADTPISNQSFTLISDVTDVYNYSLGHIVNIGLSGTFTIDESQVSNGQIVKIEDTSVTADISGLEASLINNVQTIIVNDKGERLGALGLSSAGLTLNIDPSYNIKDGLETFTFTNATAFKLQPTQQMLDANKNVIQTVQVGTGNISVTYHEQTNYDITKLASNYTGLALGSGATGYGQGFLYRVAFNQLGLNELQNSQGSTASLSNLQKGDYLTAYTLSSNVIPQGNSFVVNAYIASEADNKLKTTRTDGSTLASTGATKKNISLPYDDLGPSLSLEQMKSLVTEGVDKTYMSKQTDGTYLILQNISKNTLTLTADELKDTKNSPLSSIDPTGQATVNYYSQALQNRATYAGATLGFRYVDPTIINTVKIEMVDPNTGNVIHTTTKDSVPQQIIPEGQGRIKIHYVDDEGNALDTLSITDGWPGDQYITNSKTFGGYTLNTKATSIPGVILSGNDKIASSEEQTLDYPEAGKVTNLYYVYTKDPVAAADVTAKYVDTEGNKISDDVVKSGNIGDKYTTEQKDIEGYTFKEMGKDSAAVSGDFTAKAQTVTYVYTKNPVAAADVTVKYVDTEGNKISDDVVKSGNIGDKYTTEQKDIEGYTFKEMGKDSAAVSGDFTAKAQTVTYVYTKNPVAAADVTAKYVDTEGNKISDDVVKSGNIGDKYTTEQKDIEGYTFKEMGKDSAAVSGDFTAKAQTVTYVYTKDPVAAADVTAKYVDTEGNKISDDVVKSGNIGDKYTTEQKDIEGYTFKEMGKDSAAVSGDFTAKAQTVTYVYTKNPVAAADVTVKYVDTEGNKISDDVVKSGNIGDKYTTEQKDIEGYTFKEMSKDSAAVSGDFTAKAQTVTYVYTKNPVAAADVTVKYVDTEGNKISDDVVKSGNIGDKYTTEQKRY